MDTATLGMVLAVAGGIGGAGLVMSGEIRTELGTASIGIAQSGGSGRPTEDQTLPKLPPWIRRCPICPLILGAAVAAGLWAAADAARGVPTPQPVLVLIAASVLGLVVGTAAGALYRGIGSVLR